MAKAEVGNWVQLIASDGESVTILSWSISDETAAVLRGQLGEPIGEYLAPAERGGYERRVEL